MNKITEHEQSDGRIVYVREADVIPTLHTDVPEDNLPNKNHTRMPQEVIDKQNGTKYAPNDTPTVG